MNAQNRKRVRWMACNIPGRVSYIVATFVSLVILSFVPMPIDAQGGLALPCGHPLSEGDLTTLVNGVPARRVGQLVSICGLDFDPTTPALDRLRLAHTPETVIAAVRAGIGPAERKRTADEALWKSIKESPDPQVFEQFLEEHPDNRYVGAARLRLAEIKPKEIAAGTKKVNSKDGQPYVWIPPGKFTMGCPPGNVPCTARRNLS